MPSSSRDPRCYVKQLPLPIDSHKGVKIQARSDTVYNATCPTREVIRKENYARRLQQLTQQGFSAVSHKPYQGIGDPFFLEERKLILSALGQWDDNTDDEASTTSDEDDELKADSTTPKPITPAKFILRKNRKDLNTLNKEVVHARHLMRNVSLGHGLFHLITQERQAKLDAAADELRKEQLRQRTEWQPAKRETKKPSDQDSDVTDDELGEDVDLKSYFSPNIYSNRETNEDVPITLYDPSDPKNKVAFTGLETSAQQFNAFVRPTPKSNSKRKLPSCRPYTPQTNILHDDGEDPREKYYSEAQIQALFRQLCALYWMLEAMMMESSNMITPICTSWNLREIGGAKNSPKKIAREKVTETNWNSQFLNAATPNSVRPAKRFSSTPRSSRLFRKTSSNQINSANRSSLTSPASSIGQLNVGGGSGGNVRVDDTIPEDEESVSIQESAEDEEIANTGIFGFLDEYYASMNNMAAAADTGSIKTDDTADKPNSGRKCGRESQTPKPHRKLSSRRSSSHGIDILNDGGPRATQDVRLSSRNSRGTPVRPKSSPALVDFQNSLPSTQRCRLLAEMRQKFSEVGEERAIDLHEMLEHMERQRLRVCQNKFSHLPMRRSFHRAIEYMRTKSIQDEKPQEKMRRTSGHTQWYSDILQSLTDDITSIWYFHEILTKLSKHGMVESSKHSTYKFLRVLSGLREWEICSPDVSAAIEFCRERVVEMSPDEYEEWIGQQFPAVRRPVVQRPQTAPANLRNSTQRK
ncbi:coiled-coil domain-containing protein 60-like [Tubulanus polymorphus]|uniref:coiled-coil domain-containing protein 60-like n=1 Tax=Tubulanus polymorphus TaxID=672921 RepID=UPI003DA38504